MLRVRAPNHSRIALIDGPRVACVRGVRAARTYPILKYLSTGIKSGRTRIRASRVVKCALCAMMEAYANFAQWSHARVVASRSCLAICLYTNSNVEPIYNCIQFVAISVTFYTYTHACDGQSISLQKSFHRAHHTNNRVCVCNIL